MSTWVSLAPMFSPMWDCAFPHATSPALTSRTALRPSDSVSLRLKELRAHRT